MRLLNFVPTEEQLKIFQKEIEQEEKAIAHRKYLAEVEETVARTIKEMEKRLSSDELQRRQPISTERPVSIREQQATCARGKSKRSYCRGNPY